LVQKLSGTAGNRMMSGVSNLSDDEKEQLLESVQKLSGLIWVYIQHLIIVEIVVASSKLCFLLG
jgi:hypothetical protein